MKADRRPRIALLGDGVLGGSYSGHGIPVLNDLFARLSDHFEFHYYSFRRVNPEYLPNDIRWSQVTNHWMPGRIKYFLLALKIIRHHFKTPFSFILSISDYPSGLFGVLLAKFLNRPSLVQLIAFEAARLDDIGWGGLINKRQGRITRFVCRYTHVLIMVAEYQRKIASVHLPTTRNIEVLPLRINPKNFIYRKRQINYPVEFIQVGYYSALKDQNTLFKAFSIVAKQLDCRLTVVGEGFDTPSIKVILESLHIADKVNCVGFIPQSELATYYDRAHILLHTARFETGCAVIQEAMASGVAVCGTDVGLLADIGNNFAVVVPAANPENTANEILNLVNNPLLFSYLTSNAYKWICEHDATWAYENYKSLFDSIIKRGAHSFN